MHNLITEAGFQTRMALRDQAVMDKILDRATDTLSESTQRRIASAGGKLVRYMLFADEVELDDPIAGTWLFGALCSAGPLRQPGPFPARIRSGIAPLRNYR